MVKNLYFHLPHFNLKFQAIDNFHTTQVDAKDVPSSLIEFESKDKNRYMLSLCDSQTENMYSFSPLHKKVLKVELLSLSIMATVVTARKDTKGNSVNERATSAQVNRVGGTPPASTSSMVSGTTCGSVYTYHQRN